MTEKQQILSGVPEGYDVLILEKLLRVYKIVYYVAVNDIYRQNLKESLATMFPDIKILDFPAWDTVPYDRVSPNCDIEGERLNTLFQISQEHNFQIPTLILTSVSACLQKVPSVDFFKGRVFDVYKNGILDEKELQSFLSANGYVRVTQVIGRGEYAIRGGIIDVYPVGTEYPVRLDLFGNEVDTIRTFEPLTQKTIADCSGFSIPPMSEFEMTTNSIALFRTQYRDLFPSILHDSLYENVSQGIKVSGLEHWMPLFFEQMCCLFDYVPNALIVMGFGTDDALKERIEQIKEYYQARLLAAENKTDMEMVYHPIPMERMFLNEKTFDEALKTKEVFYFSPFVLPNTKDMGGRVNEGFISTQGKQKIFDKLASYIKQRKEKVVIGALTSISLDRFINMLKEKDVRLSQAISWDEALKKTPSVMLLPIDKGFKSPEVTLFTETDLFGEKAGLISRYKRKKENFVEDVSCLSKGDLVVHISHGIGRYEGLMSLSVGSIVHDCLMVVYADEDKLFVPVENLDVLTRYGSENAQVVLDKLGGVAWEARKTNIKKRLLDMAKRLVEIAAVRVAQKTEKISPPAGIYNEFCAQFPYVETPDQMQSIYHIIEDFKKGFPIDRLVCGDVGFGKTEVALRAAFIAVMNGLQVAVIVPTTLLARQHYDTFVSRFKGFPVKIGRLSRLVNEKEKKMTKKGLEDGTIQIVIGTHAILSKSVQFKNLGLLIVDEEQHFGVAHKEKLKEMKSGLHVITLTATPIPRTLQMSLTGVKDLSVIATPPIDRMSVNTFVLPFDPIIIKDALLREKNRGGQTFYVCPRISDMPLLLERLHRLVPEIKIVSAHGQMSSTQLELIMNDFADKKYDVLLVTSIIESGLDMPSVNTIVVHKADMFGLANLYQLRGRVGRSKTKAYAYLTTIEGKKLTDSAQKRLSVLQSLDNLGAGFTLASHDLDIRGAGNLLGQEQSGHIKEVGVELYQKMLEDAVAQLKQNPNAQDASDNWSPQVGLGLCVLIPEKYLPDLNLRMELYYRIANIEQGSQLEDMFFELKDRFGELPEEVINLLETVRVKILCKSAFVERIDASEKGMTISFHKNFFPNPVGLVNFINAQMGLAKLKPDKLTIIRSWQTQEDRINGVKRILELFSKLAKGS